MPNENNETAVVLGAGFAGLLTAAVLTKFYRQVTVVDHDPASRQYRQSIPQGRHAHNLPPAGTRVTHYAEQALNRPNRKAAPACSRVES
ncbi:NAD(P)-binding protein [Streptomyces mirabilis]|uniref:NAD(P)-binding protein n=1 Tax=Streptomyces mirabilis TaxID=68239 RepID=UPI003648BCA0